MPTLPFVQQNNNVFNLNATFMAQLEELDKSCGYAEYRDKYMTFPPSGLQPPTFFNYSSETDLACDVFDMVITASYATNPCANVYEITHDADGYGTPDKLTRENLLTLIRDAGFQPKERNTRYEIIREYDGPVPLAQRRAEPQTVWA